jgi:hypothetical protein
MIAIGQALLERRSPIIPRLKAAMTRQGAHTPFWFSKNSERAPKRAKTAVSFTGPELEDLAQIIAVGQALLKIRSSSIPRLKAAMTRLGVRTPAGLI